MNIDELPAYTYHSSNAKYEGFEARCVEIPELSAYGDTESEALKEIKVAVAGWLEVLEEEGIPFPTPVDSSNFGNTQHEATMHALREIIARTAK